MIQRLLTMLGAMASLAMVGIGVLIASTGCDTLNPVVPTPVVLTVTPAPTTLPTIADLGSICPDGAVPGEYIVSLNIDPGIAREGAHTFGGELIGDVVADIAQEYGLTVMHIFSSSTGGFSAFIPDAQHANVKADSRVEGVYPNCIIRLEDR